MDSWRQPAGEVAAAPGGRCRTSLAAPHSVFTLLFLATRHLAPGLRPSRQDAGPVARVAVAPESCCGHYGEFQ